MKGLTFVGIAIGIADDPRIIAMAAALRKDRWWLAGHFPIFLGRVAEHTPTGNLADFDDATLDAWAGDIRGFGAEVRARLCDGDQLRAWEFYNGQALRTLQYNRDRLKEYRRQKKAKRDDGESPPPRRSRTSTRTVRESVREQHANVGRTPPTRTRTISEGEGVLTEILPVPRLGEPTAADHAAREAALVRFGGGR